MNWEKCQKSSPAMEAEGPVVLWQRSVESHVLRYMKFIGDGDSKSYSNVLETKPYGD